MTIVRTSLHTSESARRIRFEPGGGIVATNVQEAIEEVAPGRARKQTLVTASVTYNVTATDEDVLFKRTVSPAAMNVLMPLSSAKNGVATFLKDVGQNAGTFNITLLTSGGETIDGYAGGVLKINTNGGSFELRPDPTGGYYLR
jgi:hypothetical protein